MYRWFITLEMYKYGWGVQCQHEKKHTAKSNIGILKHHVTL
jgi:hypothetical protein